MYSASPKSVEKSGTNIVTDKDIEILFGKSQPNLQEEPKP